MINYKPLLEEYIRIAFKLNPDYPIAVIDSNLMFVIDTILPSPNELFVKVESTAAPGIFSLYKPSFHSMLQQNSQWQEAQQRKAQQRLDTEKYISIQEENIEKLKQLLKCDDLSTIDPKILEIAKTLIQ